MTAKQRILKLLYPVFSAVTKVVGKRGTVSLNKSNALPKKSIFELTFTDNKGNPVSFAGFKGKKMLLVNTASNCGYTAQYDELQELYSSKKDELVVIAFPSNDFHDQETGDNKEIEEFCKINYGVTFPLASKSVVTKKENQDTVFKWLTNPSLNGWNSQQPEWNFSKYLLNERGTLIGYYGAAISPLDKQILEHL
jgi:glutathione peroxidase